MRIRELVPHVGWKRTGITQIQGVSTMEALGGGVPVQVVKHDGAVYEGFGIAIVDFERLVELLERTLSIPIMAKQSPARLRMSAKLGWS